MHPRATLPPAVETASALIHPMVSGYRAVTSRHDRYPRWKRRLPGRSWRRGRDHSVAGVCHVVLKTYSLGPGDHRVLISPECIPGVLQRISDTEDIRAIHWNHYIG